MGIYKPGRPTTYQPSTGRGTKPPASPGEYRILDEDHRILYIGETCDLQRRMKEHQRSGKLSGNRTLAYQTASEDSDSESRRGHERDKIGQHHPQLNRSSGGEGRIAGR